MIHLAFVLQIVSSILKTFGTHGRRVVINDIVRAFVEEVRTLHQRQDPDFLTRLEKMRMILSEMESTEKDDGRLVKQRERNDPENEVRRVA
jgi:hypothetical protein